MFVYVYIYIYINIFTICYTGLKKVFEQNEI